MSSLSETKDAHLAGMYRRLGSASSAGKVKLTRHYARQLLTSHDAKLAATKAAYKKKGRPRVPEEMKAVAEGICPWKGSAEPVKLYSVPKGSAGRRRLIMDFGIENRTLQYLVVPALKLAANLHPYQFGTKGVPYAIDRVASKMAEGYVFACELDIQDCFPSFVEEKLPQFLPLPKEVIRHVIVSAHLNLVSGNLHELFGLAEDGAESPLTTETFVLARRGIPQGSAVSSIVSEIVLSSLYHALPLQAVVAGYADNTLLMGKTAQEAVSITQAFWGSLKEHPVGLLEPKLRGNFNKGQPIDCLGHRLSVQSGKILIEPHPHNLTDFGREIQRRLKRIKTAQNSFQKGQAERAYRGHVYSWTANFCRCTDIDAIRKKAMEKLAAVK
jgi:reverse transcriptase-like protein